MKSKQTLWLLTLSVGITGSLTGCDVHGYGVRFNFRSTEQFRNG
ncbi:hypothetical protein NZD89_23815 [Alicyclobacillus fastidiosus]|uniref:Lipoprotein n=1 Tax=Alicyclobacillus fastidiosus TaxID=392011 RepID=A0ABY6ZED1_9BACL|nr:hypothetical protein [Alicyclobacillus fastidiosus]WAH41254.1 hypothetical protein NZD89_23815 [Alicyclobacillus fastidiosus]